MAIIRGILNGWGCVFEQGIPTDNYIGDIFGSLGGTPDFGLGSQTGGGRLQPGGDMAAADEKTVGKSDDVDPVGWKNPDRPTEAKDKNTEESPETKGRRDWPPPFRWPRQCETL